MSEGTITSAMISILTLEVGSSFRQIVEVGTVPFVNGLPSIQPQDTPALVLQMRTSPEAPVTFGRSKIEHDVDIHCWWAVAIPPGPDASGQFDTMTNSVLVGLRAHPKLDGLANVAGQSAVLIAGRRMTVHKSAPLARRGGAHTWYHCVITDRVQEWVQSPIT